MEVTTEGLRRLASCGGVWRKGLTVMAVLCGVVLCAGAVAGAAPFALITEYSTGLNTGSAPADITASPNGSLWFTDQGTTKAIGEITTSGAIMEFALPTTTTTPRGIAIDSGGNIWFAAAVNGGFSGLEEFDPATPGFTLFPVTGSATRGVAIGPDGNVWFTDDRANGAIGVLCLTSSAICTGTDPMNHTVIEFTSGLVTASGPKNIIAGPDGNLWFADTGTGATPSFTGIGEIDPATGVIQEFATDNPGSLAAGPDRNVWFTDRKPGAPGSAISVMCLVTGPLCTSTDVSSHQHYNFAAPLNSTPEGIAAGPDGNLWYGDDGTNSIGEVDPSTGAVHEYAVATNGGHAGSKPAGIAAGPDGNMWFSDKGTTRAIGRFGLDQLMLQPVTFNPVEGIGFSGTIATGTDADPATTGADFTCTIDWGDGSAVDPACTVGGPSSGQLTVAGSHRYAAHGSYPVTVTLRYVDSPASTLTTTSTADVATALGKGKNTCNGLFGGSGGSVVVPSGAHCTLLAGTQSSGNVQVQPGGSLNDGGAAITGNLQADGATSFEVTGGSVGGNLQSQNGTGTVSVDGALVGGNLQVQDDAAGATVTGNTVDGNLQVQDNGAVTVTGNTADGNVQVQDNAGGSLTGNTAGRNCQLQQNNPKIVGSGNTAHGHQNTCNSTA